MQRLIKQLTGWKAPFFVPTRRQRAECLPLPLCRTQTLRYVTVDPEWCRPVLALTIRLRHEPIDGASTTLFWSCLTVYEREETARRQSLCQAVLWCGDYGVVLGVCGAHACMGVPS